MFTTLCTMIGAYVIASKVVVPMVEVIDDKMKISETMAYGMKKVMKKLEKKNEKK